WNSSRAVENDNGWIDVDPRAGPESSTEYSSLLGINTFGLEYNNETVYDIAVESTYINLDCEAVGFGILFNKSEEYVSADVLDVSSMVYENIRQAPPLNATTPWGYTSF